MNLIKTPQSKADVAEIWVSIALANVSAADRLVDEIDSALERLCQYPALGRSREDLLPGLRSLVVQKYLLFYRIAPEGIELVRVIHGARNLKRQFKRRRRGEGPVSDS
jgi:toxin ParE1/3/4